MYKPNGESTADFLAGIDGEAPVWQRQMVLGPAPKFCVGRGGPPRHPVVPFARPP